MDTICLESKEDSMKQTILSRSSSSPELVGAGESLKRSVLTGHRMTVSRVIGALFLCGFLLYGVGSVLVTSVTGGSYFLSPICATMTLSMLRGFLILLYTA